MSNHIRWCVKIDNNYVIVCRRRRRENFGTVPPKHDFPMQKQCFGSVSEAFSTAKPLKNSQFFSASGRITKKPPLVKRSSKRRGGFFVRGGLFRWNSTDLKLENNKNPENSKSGDFSPRSGENFGGIFL